MNTFVLGVNYWPRRSAMYMWERFDLGEIREDFARIRELGLDVVRFFISWDDFEPRAGSMDARMLRRFDAVVDAIAVSGLRAMPTFFTGHMSGINYLPAWALDPARPHGRFRTFERGLRQLPWGAGNFYTGELLARMKAHVRAIGERVRDHQAMYLWDLGNEFSNLRAADSPADSAHWSRTLSGELFDASGFQSTAGTHGEDLTADRGIRPSSFCAPLAASVMHGYTVYTGFSRSRTDPEVIPFLCQLMQSMSGKPVLFNEFGNPTCPPGFFSPYDREPLPGDPPAELPGDPPQSETIAPRSYAPYACLSEDEMADYCTGVLDRLQRRGALGAFWWNWADYAKELAQTPPFDRARHELSFGMIRNDGSYKPVAFALQSFARGGRRIVPPPPPIVREDDWYSHMDKAYHSAMYQQYLAMYSRPYARA